MKLIIGLLLAICVGIGCRWFGIPLPGPPAIMGAAMAVAMATGYTMTDHWLTRKSSNVDSSLNANAADSIEKSGETPRVNARDAEDESSSK